MTNVLPLIARIGLGRLGTVGASALLSVYRRSTGDHG
jgi:hypothetical protein